MPRTLDDICLPMSYRDLGPGFFAEPEAEPLPNATLAALNADLCADLGIDSGDAAGAAILRHCSGGAPVAGTRPLAMVYAGHQFGVYVPRLGDGRGLLLAELDTGDGQRADLHLKGAGQTPYSRNGDGRAVLRSVIREYLGSEAMHGLGIPTTRALAIAASDEPVHRERIERAAGMLRVARSHVRFGTFEYFYYRGEEDALRRLADYVIARHYPELGDDSEPHLSLFAAILARSADLVAHWTAIGFTHGVLNTDNMSVVGETLDYGPYGFLDAYEPGFIPNHSDHTGRYAFDRQPDVVLWNLGRLAIAFTPLVAEEALVGVLQTYRERVVRAYTKRMAARLGFATVEAGDAELLQDLLDRMARDRVDYSRLFRALCEWVAGEPAEPLRDRFLDREGFDGWLEKYRARLAREDGAPGERATAMRQVNPCYVLRNYLAENVIRAAEAGDYGPIEDLRRVLARPFDAQPGNEAYAAEPPEWGRHLEISCSS